MTKFEGFQKEKLANLHTGTCTEKVTNNRSPWNLLSTFYSFSNFHISSSQFEVGNNQRYVQ